MRFHRGEQMAKLRTIVRSLLTMQRVDKFHLTTSEKKVNSKGPFGNVSSL
jgi:hypothetical protein